MSTSTYCINHRLFLRLGRSAIFSMQRAHLSAFGEDVFAKAHAALNFAHAQFCASLGAEKMQPFSLKDWKGFPMISLSNRYFTKQESLPHEALTTFKDGVDPKKIIYEYGMSSDVTVVNVDENRVRYYELISVNNQLGESILIPICNLIKY